ncbi:stabilin-1 [Discoglossus pictus]
MLCCRVSLVLSLAYLASMMDGAQSATTFCNVKTNVYMETDCTSCAASANVICPKNAYKETTGKGKKGCRYTVDTGGVILSLVGCSHVCRISTEQRKCCKGQWGSSCSQCPGGSIKPCSEHGTCMDGIHGNGTCVCDEGFSGFTCNKCVDEAVYGPNCDSECECVHGICNSGQSGDGRCTCEAGYTGPKCDKESLPCKALNCGLNSRCVGVGVLRCDCMPGYTRKGNKCEVQKICKPASCSPFANCKVIGPRLYNCTCKDGYYGDGQTCLPINPCNVNNGGCMENSTQCVYLRPGKSYCGCKPGMTRMNPSAGCTFSPFCRNQMCGKSAQCEVTSTGEQICTCHEGEVGDGRNCYGNILYSIQKFNMDRMNSRNLLDALRMFQDGCALNLRKYGPFTIFVPTSKLEKMSETDAIERCKDHIIAGQYLASELQNTNLWTLRGEEMEFSKLSFIVKSRPDNAYRIIRSDLPASNGIIHLIDKPIDNGYQEPIGNHQKTIGDILAQTEQFSRFETMLENCGLPPILNGAGPFTVFVPSNKAVDSLRDGRLIYLFTRAQHKLLELVKNHIFTTAAVSVGRLIAMPQILTSANEVLKINITENGRITLGDLGAVLHHTDIMASNGIIHLLDGILIPSSILPILPHKCNETHYEDINGTCSRCDSVVPCPDQSTDLGITEGECTFTENGTSALGCARKCRQTITELGCCRGFYGPECKPCTGGFTDPCYGRGICNDGIRGNGKCECSEQFKGTACHICTNPNKHGQFCDEDCPCVHGTCDNRPGSGGVCQGRRCKADYTGAFCDQHIEPCGALNVTQYCHLNAVCVVSGNISRCVCNNGFEGDGNSCRPVDLCKKPDRGGCSENAMCANPSPGNVTCQCNFGWTGDGFDCSPINNCLLEARGGCHINADCNYIQPGENDCTCKRGYAGDGYLCDLVDPCLDNNGGCHEMAKCKPSTGADRICTCPEGFAGDGLICYGDILMELRSNPDVNIFNQWIKDAKLTIETGVNVTALVPSDVVIEAVPEDQKKFWLDQYRLPFLVRSHFLQGAFNSDQLKQSVGKELSTMDPRTKWEVESINGSLTINNASFVVTDIPSVNGYIFIINKILFPPLGSVPPARPKLTQQLAQIPAFSKFQRAMQEYGLTQEIEASEQKYTIFVPVNAAVDKYCNESAIEQMDNNTVKYHIILGSKLLPADLNNGFHKESMLGISYWLMFFKKNNQTFVHDAPLDGTFYETKNGILTGVSKVLEIQKNRCDSSVAVVNKTKCNPCWKPIQCPEGTTLEASTAKKCFKDSKARGCKYKRRNKAGVGCTYKCVRSSVVQQCCKGYFGHQCLMCPGKPGNPCSGNGNCQDGIDGSGDCICEEGYHGTACETCEPGRYGSDCKSDCLCVHGRCNDGLLGDGSCQCEKGWSGYTCERDIKNDLCNDTCSIYANCIIPATNSTPTCACVVGYFGNGTHCTEIDACAVSNGGCSKYATCKNVLGGLRLCTCVEGYTGDGVVCIEIDACLENNGGCHTNAECIKTGPNKVACNCLPGHKGDGIKDCSAISPCKTNNGGCSPYARCIFKGPGERTCTCRAEYNGDGFTCTGDTAQELSQDLDTKHFYRTLTDNLVSDVKGEGPFTVFVPEPYVFGNSTTLEEWKNKTRITDLLRYHLVGCQKLLLSDLTEEGSITALSGGIIRISSKEDGVYLNGDTKITRGDKITKNGVIHFIDKILIPEMQINTTELTEPSKLNITSVLEMYGYSMFSKLLKDYNLLSLVNDKIHQPFTMLWPTDDAFNSLSEDRKKWLYHKDHRDKVVAYLKVHIIRSTKVIAANLPHTKSIRTMHGSTLSFTCSKTNIGEIMVNKNDARIIQRHMEFNGGIAYGIDQLLEPPDIGARCDKYNNIIFGSYFRELSNMCGLCGLMNSRCPFNTVDTGETEPCLIHPRYPIRGLHRYRTNLYNINPYGAFGSSRLGCKRICVTVTWVPGCCKNHHGRDCQVCPGGLEAPCSNRGTCDDGMAGTGNCTCSEGFDGTACEICTPGRYGSNCTACSCTENGICNDGVSGDGACFCNAGWSGQRCEVKLNMVPVCSPDCDDNGTCRANNTCECNPYYDGDGRICTLIDRCKDENGGCSVHANCTQLGVVVSCSCFPDYEGDGYICNPIDLCANGYNGGCSEHATCINVGPNIRRCECHEGYVGNGVQCLEKAIPPTDRCLEQNGGCHPVAECADLHYQEKTAGVFHLQSPKGKYQFTYREAEDACESEGASVATFSQLSAAQQMGLHLCIIGWLDNRTAGYPTTYPSASCGSNHVGIVDYKQREDASERYDVYCFRVKDVQCMCADGYVGNGFFCNGNLLEVLEADSQLSVFYSMLLDYANATEKGVELMDFLSNRTSYKTLFVPNDDSFGKNVTLSWRDLEHHVSEMDFLLTYSNLTNGTTLPSKAGHILSISDYNNCTQSSCTKAVNNKIIVQWDIPAFNGIIHVINGPLIAPEESIKRPISHSVTTGVVVALVMILAGAAVTAGIFYYKQHDKGFQFRHFQEEEDTYTEQNGNPTLVSIPNPVYGANNVFFDPFEDSFGDEDDSDTRNILH